MSHTCVGALHLTPRVPYPPQYSLCLLKNILTTQPHSDRMNSLLQPTILLLVPSHTGFSYTGKEDPRN
jgi:hypothetical protein